MLIDLLKAAREECLTNKPNLQLITDNLTEAIRTDRYFDEKELLYILSCLSFAKNESQHDPKLQRAVAEKAKAAGVLTPYEHLLDAD